MCCGRSAPQAPTSSPRSASRAPCRISSARSRSRSPLPMSARCIGEQNASNVGIGNLHHPCLRGLRGAARLGGARRARASWASSCTRRPSTGRALDDRLGAALPDGGLTGSSVRCKRHRRGALLDRASMLDIAARLRPASSPRFRWPFRERYNIGVDVCDRWAASEPERPAILEVCRRRRGHAASPTARCASARTGWRNALRARGIARGDRVAHPAARRAPRCRSRMSPSTSSAPSRCRWRLCSASMRISYRLRDAGAKALVTNARGRWQSSQQIDGATADLDVDR